MTARTLRYLVAAVAIGILFLVCCTKADARSPFWRPLPAAPPYSFSIEDEHGNSLATFVKDGRSFILGEPGQRYNIRIRNPTDQRVEAVLSVDGRDAISGQPGDYVNQRGYVIPAYDSLLVEGFRRSLEEVAVFRFTSPADSYSSRLGTPQNVGVIGVAFFPERAHPIAPVMRRARPLPHPAPSPYDYSRDSRSPRPDLDSDGAALHPQLKPSAPSAGAAPAREARVESAARASGPAQDSVDDARTAQPSRSVNHLGTEFGESQASAVSSVSFERASASHPARLSTLRYDDADGLSARGIDVSAYRSAHDYADEPQAFPVSRFAEPPP